MAIMCCCQIICFQKVPTIESSISSDEEVSSSVQIRLTKYAEITSPYAFNVTLDGG